MWLRATFREFLRPNSRPYTLGPEEDAHLVGMRLYGVGPFHRELKPAMQIAKKSHFVIRAGDVIYNKLFAWKGTFGIVPPALDGMFVSDKFPTYELDRSRVDERFLAWYFRCPPLWEEARVMSTGSAALSKLTLNPPKFLLLTIPLPPLAEQRRMVARIEELAAQIHEARTLRHQAAEEAAVLLPSGMAGIFKKLGGKHPTKKLEELCDVVRGGSPRPAGTPLYYGGDIPFLKVGDLTRDDGMYLYEASASVNELGREQSRFIEVDTLMLTNSGATLGVPKITKIAGCFNDGSQAFLNLSPSVEKEFLYYLFKSKTLWFREQLARGQGQPNLNTDMTKQMDVPVPPLPEQRRIVAELDALQAEVDALKRLQTETAAQLDALLPAVLDRAFKGEL